MHRTELLQVCRQPQQLASLVLVAARRSPSSGPARMVGLARLSDPSCRGWSEERSGTPKQLSLPARDLVLVCFPLPPDEPLHFFPDQLQAEHAHFTTCLPLPSSPRTRPRVGPSLIRPTCCHVDKFHGKFGMEVDKKMLTRLDRSRRPLCTHACPPSACC